MKPYERVIFFIIMTGLWGASIIISLGMAMTIIDSLFGTNSISFVEKIMSGGNKGFLKVWLCGLPFSLLTGMHLRK